MLRGRLALNRWQGQLAKKSGPLAAPSWQRLDAPNGSSIPRLPALTRIEQSKAQEWCTRAPPASPCRQVLLCGAGLLAQCLSNDETSYENG